MRIALLLVMVSFLPIVNSASAAPQASSAKEEVAQLERDWSAAMSRGDADALSRMLADNVRSIDGRGGVRTKTTFMEMQRKRFQNVSGYTPACKEVLDSVDVEVFGDTAMATGGYSVTCPSGKEERTSSATFADLAVKRDGRWQFVLMTSTDRPGPHTVEDSLNRAGYLLLKVDKRDEAIDVFKMNVRLFPNSWNTHDSLGEAYAAAGQKDLAIKSYEKSVELNPKNTTGLEALKTLRQH